MHPILRSVAVASLMVAPWVAHAATDEPPLDQVKVEANRADVVKMGKEVQMLQMRFYELYNSLNKNRNYAIECENAATTGTRFKRNDCQPAFKNKAEQQAAREFLIAFGGGDQVTGTPDGVTGPAQVIAPPPPVSAISGTSTAPASGGKSAGQNGFQQHMLEMTRRSPELQKLAEEHATLWKRYYSAYRQLNGAPPLPDEPSGTPAGSAAPPKSP